MNRICVFKILYKNELTDDKNIVKIGVFLIPIYTIRLIQLIKKFNGFVCE